MTVTTSISTGTAPTPPRRRRIIATGVVILLVLIAGASFVVVRSRPQYRTEFLLDTSSITAGQPGSDFTELTQAMAGAAANAGDRDALALRQFGGTCGNHNDTRLLVGSHIGNSTKITHATTGLAPTGQATLYDGIMAAIHDFAHHYPLRGSALNRIVVVTTHATDACTTGDQTDTANEQLQHQAAALGVDLQIRIVGYKIPTQQQDTLTKIASTITKTTPTFAQNAAQLSSTLKKLRTSNITLAQHIK